MGLWMLRLAEVIAWGTCEALSIIDIPLPVYRDEDGYWMGLSDWFCCYVHYPMLMRLSDWEDLYECRS